LQVPESGRWYVAMNAGLARGAKGGVVNVEKVDNLDAADAEGYKTLAGAQRIHVLARLSNRWAKRSFATDTEFLDTVYPGSTHQRRSFDIHFYSEAAAQAWSPPYGVRMKSQVGSTVTVEVQKASSLILLDVDLQIENFDF